MKSISKVHKLIAGVAVALLAVIICVAQIATVLAAERTPVKASSSVAVSSSVPDSSEEAPAAVSSSKKGSTGTSQQEVVVPPATGNTTNNSSGNKVAASSSTASSQTSSASSASAESASAAQSSSSEAASSASSAASSAASSSAVSSVASSKPASSSAASSKPSSSAASSKPASSSAASSQAPSSSSQSASSSVASSSASSSSQPASSSSSEIKTGWQTIDGKQYYYDSTGKAVSGQFTDAGKTYYAAADGAVQSGLITAADGVRYADPSTLVLQAGWKAIDSNTYYFGSGFIAANGQTTIDGVAYLFSGSILQGRTLTVTFKGVVTTDLAKNILARIVAGETGGLNSVESYRAQAVAAQSYILFYNNRGTVAPSMVDGTPTQAIRDAVAPVADIAVYYNGAPANAVYTASNSGVTNSSTEVWNTNYAYLTAGIESKYDYLSTNFTTSFTVTRAQMETALTRMYNGSGNSPLSFSHDPSTWIGYTTVDKAGRAVAAKMQLDIRFISGGESRIYAPTANWFKENSGLGIRSNTFAIVYNGNQTWTVTTYGYGHGVGLSQWGAYYYAKNDGWNYQQILAHYYPGTTLQNLAPTVS